MHRSRKRATRKRNTKVHVVLAIRIIIAAYIVVLLLRLSKDFTVKMQNSGRGTEKRTSHLQHHVVRVEVQSVGD